ncbi:MAG: RNA polymerase sigma factor [Mangrovicoccus sp.]
MASDEDLLAAYAAGDPNAARVLMLRLTPAIYGLAVRMLGDKAEAEDVTQEAMLRLWKIAPDWQAGSAKPSTWLYRVAANLCTDRLRRRRTVAWEEGFDPADDAASPAEEMQEKARQIGLQDALNDLPERQRQAVVLRHLEGLNNPQIAEIMEISVEAVESLTARGKRSLAKLLVERKQELGYTDDG